MPSFFEGYDVVGYHSSWRVMYITSITEVEDILLIISIQILQGVSIQLY